jgi:hypothetical protein
MWWVGVLIAVVSAVLRRLNVASMWPGAAPFVIFPGLAYNAGMQLSKRQGTAIAASALVAGSVFMAPRSLPLEAVALAIVWAAGYLCIVLEAGLVVRSAHSWAVWAGAKCQPPTAHAWRTGVLVVAGVQALTAVYLFVFRVERGWVGLAGLLLSAAVVAHNVVHDNGVIVSATTVCLFAAVCLTVGTSSSWVAGWVSGQLLTPLALGLLGALRGSLAILVLLLAVFARSDLRVAQAFLALLAAPALLIAQQRLEV